MCPKCVSNVYWCDNVDIENHLGVDEFKSTTTTSDGYFAESSTSHSFPQTVSIGEQEQILLDVLHAAIKIGAPHMLKISCL